MTDDELIATMFDEVKEVPMVNGKPRVTDEQTVADMDAVEMKNSVADLLRSWRRFREIDASVAATSGAQLGIEWWRSLQYLALADSRMKEAFIGGDRSPRSIRLYHQYKLRLIEGAKKLPADA
jgi:hypothetical protein